MIRIERVEQYVIEMPLRHPFVTSMGREDSGIKVITAVYADGLVGWGEAPVMHLPYYSPDTAETCRHVQREALIPLLFRSPIQHAADAPGLFEPVRGHQMARAGLEAALWDLEGRMVGQSVSRLLGGTRTSVEVGVSVGVQSASGELIERIAAFLNEGYRRIKIKIKPGWDRQIVAAVRSHFPGIALMVDANSAYTLADAAMLEALDSFDLLMIEQPLAHDDLLDHADLQRRLRTPICLDESITTPGRAREALHLGSCRIINIKPARVGGISAAKAIHDMCRAADIPVWCGGLLESGIGRAANLAVASLPGFTLPGDISGTDRYWEEDIIDHVFRLNHDGTLDVPQGPGIGVEVLPERLARYMLHHETFTGS